MTLPLVVGISGASGFIFGYRMLEALKALHVPVHLVLTQSALQTCRDETGYSLDDVRALAQVVHSNRDIGASIASGSFKTRGMIVIPCSIRTLSNIAYGNTDTLTSRAADVVLKERRRLVLLVRETPLHAGHLKAMLNATESGAIIMPPIPAFYTHPQSVDDIVNQIVGRALDLFDIESTSVVRWSGRESK